MIDGYKTMHKSIEFLHTRNKVLNLNNTLLKLLKHFLQIFTLKMYTIKHSRYVEMSFTNNLFLREI